MEKDRPHRPITLRYHGACAACGAALPAKTKALWDGTNKKAFCLSCPAATGVAGRGPRGAVAPPGPDSLAGGSAQARADRLHRKREERIDAKWNRLAGVVKFLSDDPQSTKAWARGAEGERQLAKKLAKLVGDRAVFLHDRKVGRANIDHLVIARSGVWVVDAKLYAGQITHRNKGGWLSPPDWRIYVGGRDRTKLAQGLQWQVAAVRKALVQPDIPVHAVLCFVSADWGWFPKPFRHDGVLVTWSKDLAERIAASGPLQADDIEAVATTLRASLRPAK